MRSWTENIKLFHIWRDILLKVKFISYLDVALLVLNS